MVLRSCPLRNSGIADFWAVELIAQAMVELSRQLGHSDGVERAEEGTRVPASNRIVPLPQSFCFSHGRSASLPGAWSRPLERMFEIAPLRRGASVNCPRDACVYARGFEGLS